MSSISSCSGSLSPLAFANTEAQRAKGASFSAKLREQAASALDPSRIDATPDTGPLEAAAQADLGSTSTTARPAPQFPTNSPTGTNAQTSVQQAIQDVLKMLHDVMSGKASLDDLMAAIGRASQSGNPQANAGNAPSIGPDLDPTSAPNTPVAGVAGAEPTAAAPTVASPPPAVATAIAQATASPTYAPAAPAKQTEASTPSDGAATPAVTIRFNVAALKGSLFDSKA